MNVHAVIPALLSMQDLAVFAVDVFRSRPLKVHLETAE